MLQARWWVAAVALCVAGVQVVDVDLAEACSPPQKIRSVVKWPGAGQTFPSNAPFRIMDKHDGLRVTVNGGPATWVEDDVVRGTFHIAPQPQPGDVVTVSNFCIQPSQSCAGAPGVSYEAGTADTTPPAIPTVKFDMFHAFATVPGHPGDSGACQPSTPTWDAQYYAEVTGMDTSSCEADVHFTLEWYADESAAEPFDYHRDRAPRPDDDWSRTPTAHAVADTVTDPMRVCVRVQAFDTAGNVGEWSELHCTPCRARIADQDMDSPAPDAWTEDDLVPGGVCDAAPPVAPDPGCWNIDDVDDAEEPASESDIYVDGGCACRAAPASTPSSAWLWLVVALGFARRRR